MAAAVLCRCRAGRCSCLRHPCAAEWTPCGQNLEGGHRRMAAAVLCRCRAGRCSCLRHPCAA
ncbi:hypothetical protein C7E17_26980, partial [Stenotrophomonas maltophilia]